MPIESANFTFSSDLQLVTTKRSAEKRAYDWPAELEEAKNKQRGTPSVRQARKIYENFARGIRSNFIQELPH